MRLYTLRQRPASLPRWWGIDRLVVPAPAAESTPPPAPEWLGAWSCLDLLGDSPEPPGPIPACFAGCPRLIIDSGRPGGEDDHPVIAWSPRAHQMLDAACDCMVPALAAAGLSLCLRPTASGVLSDIPSCADFLRRHAGRPVEVLLDPSALLADSMLGDAADHLDRIADALLGHPRVCAVMVTNLQRDGRGGLAGAPVHQGLLDVPVLAGIARRGAAAGKPVVLHPAGLAAQSAALGVSLDRP